MRLGCKCSAEQKQRAPQQRLSHTNSCIGWTARMNSDGSRHTDFGCMHLAAGHMRYPLGNTASRRHRQPEYTGSEKPRGPDQSAVLLHGYDQREGPDPWKKQLCVWEACRWVFTLELSIG